MTIHKKDVACARCGDARDILMAHMALMAHDFVGKAAPMGSLRIFQTWTTQWPEEGARCLPAFEGFFKSQNTRSKIKADQ